MIAELDEVIRKLLIDEMPIKNGEVDIAFDQPRREWSARLSGKPTINLFLYDVRENNTLRNHQWQALDRNGSNLSRQKRTPLRVDCHYAITVWATEPEDEHRVLTRVLMALYRHPVIPPERLTGRLQNQPFDLQARPAAHDKLTNTAEFWGALDNELRPTISYLLTLALDPWEEVTGPLVSTYTLRAGQSRAPARQKTLVEATEETSTFIGGTVRQQDAPAADVSVALKGTGYLTTTDREGRYVLGLGGLTPGDYTLIAWPAAGRPKERAISVPPKNRDGDAYDIDL
jgi:hypothetical protein